MRFDNSRALQRRSHSVIPGGCHTYAKGDDQYPQLSPAFIVKGRGCHVWDMDGNEFIEYGMGCRAVTLGHAYPDVVAAVRREIENGVNFCRPSPIETYCAESLLDLIKGADMAKFVKDGSAATTAAIKLARAHTGRDKVALCSDHPFFSTNDWFIGTTEMDAGIPAAVKSLSLTFSYNDIESVRALFRQHPNEIACVILEPAKYDEPIDNYLHEVMQCCHDNGALFILDEIITGFRWHNGGGQAVYNIVPDLSIFSKALGNGFAVSALLGKREYMERGGLHHNKERVFLLSTTYGAETHALAAAMATMKVYKNEPVIETLERQGKRLLHGVNAAVSHHQLGEYFQLKGRPSCLVFATLDQQRSSSQAFRSLFLQEMIRRGVIGPSFIVSYSHTDEDVDKTIEAVYGALEVYKHALDDGVDSYLVGPPSKPVDRKYN